MIKKSDTLNVLMVTPRYFPFMGGIQTHIYEVGRRLVNKGINVTLLTAVTQDEAIELPEEDCIEGMHIIRVHAWPSNHDYYIAPHIAHIIKNSQWDVIHVQGCHTFVPPVAMIAAREAKIPYILTFHTGGHSQQWRNKIRGIQWRVQRPLFAQAAKLIGVSRFETEFFRDTLHLPDRQFSIIPNGAAMTDIPNITEKNSDKDIIISIGRLERYKGHQHLINAMPKILEHYPDMQLLILGKGPYESALHELVQKVGVSDHVEIRFIPASDRGGMAQLLSQAKLVALLSEYEAHPIAVMEALVLHCPVLVTDTSGLREIAEQGWARSVPMNSTPDEIAQAVVQQIESPLVPQGDFVLPTWEDCTQRLLNEYEAAAGSLSLAAL